MCLEKFGEGRPLTLFLEETSDGLDPALLVKLENSCKGPSQGCRMGLYCFVVPLYFHLKHANGDQH